jgi:hypothetical protein
MATNKSGMYTEYLTKQQKQQKQSQFSRLASKKRNHNVEEYIKSTKEDEDEEAWEVADYNMYLNSNESVMESIEINLSND